MCESENQFGAPSPSTLIKRLTAGPSSEQGVQIADRGQSTDVLQLKTHTSIKRVTESMQESHFFGADTTMTANRRMRKTSETTNGRQLATMHQPVRKSSSPVKFVTRLRRSGSPSPTPNSLSATEGNEALSASVCSDNYVTYA
uniref:BTB domain-containing protein n=1 Tax=Plectus sambesii TaxID=2011161 RepID=A0A914V388_9BILA